MIKNKIIIALNNHSNSLASYGVSLAKRLDREATLTSVAKLPVITSTTGAFGSGISKFENLHITEVKNRLEIDLNQICLESKKIWPKVDYEVEVGFLESTLLRKADEERPFLFMIEGNHELTTLGEWMGTYETRLAEEMSVPTLIVPTNYYWKPVHDILYVMNLEDNKARNIRVLQNIAKELDANLHIMIVGEGDANKDFQTYNRMVGALKTFFDHDYIEYYYVSDIQTADEIKKMTEQMKVNWLAFEYAESTFVERVFSNLNSDRLILQSEIPVLVF